MVREFLILGFLLIFGYFSIGKGDEYCEKNDVKCNEAGKIDISSAYTHVDLNGTVVRMEPKHICQKAVGTRFSKKGFDIVQFPEKLKKEMIKFWHQHSHLALPESKLGGYTGIKIDIALHNQALADKIEQYLKEEVAKFSGLDLSDIVLTYNYKNEGDNKYGGVEIREYKRDATVVPHMDRFDVQIFTIVGNLWQEVEEPWIIDMWDHDNVKHSVDQKEGEMVIMEGVTVLHTRAMPMKGDSYVNLIVHFATPVWNKEIDMIKRCIDETHNLALLVSVNNTHSCLTFKSKKLRDANADMRKIMDELETHCEPTEDETNTSCLLNQKLSFSMKCKELLGDLFTHPHFKYLKQLVVEDDKEL